MGPFPREGQGSRHDDKAHGLVRDHRIKRPETENADEKRQPELGSPQSYQASEHPDDSAAAKGRGQTS